MANKMRRETNMYAVQNNTALITKSGVTRYLTKQCSTHRHKLLSIIPRHFTLKTAIPESELQRHRSKDSEKK